MLILSQPTADFSLVARILIVEVTLEKAFFSWDHNRRHEAKSRHKRYQQPGIIQPNGQSEYQKDESEVDGIAAESVGAGSHNHSGTLAPLYRSASSAKLSVRKQEEQHGTSNNNG